MSHLVRKQVDKMMDAYVDWREACLLVSDAYRSWSSAARPDLAVAFAWYMTALDREERAAEVYARLVRRVRELAARDHNPAATPGAPASGAASR
jgi:hypothetical protein